MDQRDGVWDLAIDYANIALILVGASPALIAGVILASVLVWDLTGWPGMILCATLAGVLLLPPSRLRARREKMERAAVPSEPIQEPAA